MGNACKVHVPGEANLFFVKYIQIGLYGCFISDVPTHGDKKAAFGAF